MISFVHKIFQRFLDFMFPLSCSLCGKSGMLLCYTCMEYAVPAQKAPDGIIVFYDYHWHPIRHGIWKLKYRGITAWADIFAELAHEKLLEELADRAIFSNFHNPLFIPVPLAPKRMRERGYNQSSLIIREIVRKSTAAYTVDETALVRVRETKNQMEIKNRAERLANMDGAFSVPDTARIKGRDVIVLDDVSTTGATLRACGAALTAAGARQVVLVSIAH